MSARLLAVALALAACQDPVPPKEFDGQATLAYAKTQLDFGPRIPGTPGHQNTADWIDSTLRKRADTVIVQAWNHVAVSGDTVPMRNFIGRFNLKAPRRILFLAHWDSRPKADQDTGSRAQQPVPAANDAASGVAVLLGMADLLKKAAPTIGVDLLFVDGEDFGLFDDKDADVLIGSKYYANNPPPGPSPEYAVLLDMVGGKGAKFPKEGNSLTGAPDIVDKVWGMASRMGYSKIFIDESNGPVIDDHVPLQKAGIKAIDVIPLLGRNSGDGGYAYWHTVEDTFDKLSAETLKAVGDVMIGLVRVGK
ncbi:MAG: M28 family peptidase [Gemmatimonadota bacterium]